MLCARQGWDGDKILKREKQNENDDRYIIKGQRRHSFRIMPRCQMPQYWHRWIPLPILLVYSMTRDSGHV